MKRLGVVTAMLLVSVAAWGEGTNPPAKPAQTNRTPIVLLPPDVEAKIANIVIPEVHWKNTSLADAVAFLNSEAKKADPDKKGIEIVLETIEEKTITFGVSNAKLKVILSALCRFTRMSMEARGGKIIITDAPQGGTGKVPGAPVF